MIDTDCSFFEPSVTQVHLLEGFKWDELLLYGLIQVWLIAFDGCQIMIARFHDLLYSFF
jgi:hypothetical protein